MIACTRASASVLLEPNTSVDHATALLASSGSRAPPVPPPPQFTYAPPDAPAPAGEPVRAVTLGFAAPYDVTYTYDPTSRTWIGAPLR